MTVSWLKKGSESANLEKQEQEAAARREAERGKLFRFYLKNKGDEAKITFVDGELNSEGFLIPPRFYEHTIEVNGQWQNFVCPQQSNPGSGEKCPICAGGDRPALVSLFTIIDHRPFERKDGTAVPYSKKLLAVKPGVMEILAKQALKRGGLAGATFEVSRMGANAAAVGDVWDFVEKTDPQVLFDKFVLIRKDEKGGTVQENLYAPADYEKEITYYTAQELMAKGVGAAGASYSPGGQKSAPGASNEQYKNAL